MTALNQIPACQTCKHFTPWREAGLDYDGDLPEDWGVCKRITADYDAFAPSENPDSKAYLMQQWSEHSDMAVAPDFGCRLHEPREDAE